MELQRTELAAGVPERRRRARRVSDKIAQVYLAREHLAVAHDNWLASAIQYARAHPLAAIGAAFVAGCLVGNFSPRSRTD